MIMASGKRGLSVASDVPQLPQNNRVRGVSRSVRANVFGSPCVNVRLAFGNTMAALGLPPLMYWHSRQ